MKRLERIYREAARMTVEEDGSPSCCAIYYAAKSKAQYVRCCPSVALFTKYFKPKNSKENCWMWHGANNGEKVEAHRAIALCLMADMASTGDHICEPTKEDQ